MLPRRPAAEGPLPPDREENLRKSLGKPRKRHRRHAPAAAGSRASSTPQTPLCIRTRRDADLACDAYRSRRSSHAECLNRILKSSQVKTAQAARADQNHWRPEPSPPRSRARTTCGCRRWANPSCRCSHTGLRSRSDPHDRPSWRAARDTDRAY